MKGKLLGSILVLLVATFLVGCQSTYPTADVHTSLFEADKQIVCSVEIKDDTETKWFFGTKYFATTAELYLKVSISNVPDIYWLYPLNVKNGTSGSKTHSIRLPYVRSKSLGNKIMIELLDDDSFSEKDAEMIRKIASEGGHILYKNSKKLYKNEKYNKDFIDGTDAKKVEKIFGDTATCAIENANQHKFTSMGNHEVNVNSIGDVYNPLLAKIIDDDGKERCHVKFYLVNIE